MSLTASDLSPARGRHEVEMLTFELQGEAFALEADFDLSRVSSNSFEMEWPPRSGRMQSFPEIDRVAWFDLDTARKKILPGQLPFIDELVGRIERKAAE